MSKPIKPLTARSYPRRSCDACKQLQFIRCEGKCAVADIEAQMRAAVERDRSEEIVPNA